LPSHPGRPFDGDEPLPRPEAPTGEAIVFTGCVMREVFGDVHRATARVLGHNGITPVVPQEQGCCGALHAHDGDLTYARKLARQNIAVFEASGETPVVVNSAGCGAAMKEYGDLLAGDVRWAA